MRLMCIFRGIQSHFKWTGQGDAATAVDCFYTHLGYRATRYGKENMKLRRRMKTLQVERESCCVPRSSFMSKETSSKAHRRSALSFVGLSLTVISSRRRFDEARTVLSNIGFSIIAIADGHRLGPVHLWSLLRHLDIENPVLERGRDLVQGRRLWENNRAREGAVEALAD